MEIIIEIAFLLSLFFLFRKSNWGYKIIALLQLFSFIFRFLVGNNIIFDSSRTVLNVLFCCINLFLITAPWAVTNINSITISNKSFFHFYKKVLYALLSFTFINNVIVLIMVQLFIPDIASFKAKMEFTELYDQVAYFGLLFRYTSVSRYFGYLAMPIVFYYLQDKNIKEARKGIIMTLPTFIAALAFYSRAQMITYGLVFLCLFYYYEKTLPLDLIKKVKKVVRYACWGVVILFSLITVSRFSSDTMWYYGDRIPKESYIKTPVLYSVADYASKGFPNGINQLELHTTDDILYGEQVYYDLIMFASYFKLISINKESVKENWDRSYAKDGLNEGNDAGTFHGYTCRMVKNFGYVLTLLSSILFFIYVRNNIRRKRINLTTATILCFLAVQPVVSIYYADYSLILYPAIFYVLVKIAYLLSSGSRIKKQCK